MSLTKWKFVKHPDTDIGDVVSEDGHIVANNVKEDRAFIICTVFNNILDSANAAALKAHEEQMNLIGSLVLKNIK